MISLAVNDTEFHDLIFELSGNPILAAMYRPVREMLVESQRLPMAHLDRLSETVREHEAILEGISQPRSRHGGSGNAKPYPLGCGPVWHLALRSAPSATEATLSDAQAAAVPARTPNELPGAYEATFIPMTGTAIQWPINPPAILSKPSPSAGACSGRSAWGQRTNPLAREGTAAGAVP